jgi:hypothetical protein
MAKEASSDMYEAARTARDIEVMCRSSRCGGEPHNVAISLRIELVPQL